MNTFTFIALFLLVVLVIKISDYIAKKRIKKLKYNLERDLNNRVKNAEEIYAKKRRRINIFTIFVYVAPIVGIALYFILKESTQKEALLVYVHQNEKYIYHSDGAYLRIDMEKGNYPNINFYSSIKLFPIGKDIYVHPESTRYLVDLLTENFTLVEYDTEQHAGFAAVKRFPEAYKITSRNVPTDKLGEIMTEKTIIITIGDKSTEIVWLEEKVRSDRNPKQTTKTPVRNCEIHNVYWVYGKYGTSSDELLVNASALVSYFNPEIELKYNTSENILFWN